MAAPYAGVELVFSKYPNTWFLFFSPRRCQALYGYMLLYGAAAAVLTFILGFLISQRVLRLEGFGLDYPWVRAIYVGVLTRTFMQFSFLSIGDEQIGVATFTDLFERHLLRRIALDEDHYLKLYVEQHKTMYPDSHDVRRRIIADIPPSMEELERKALELDVRSSRDAREAMLLALRKLGRRSFERIFPL